MTPLDVIVAARDGKKISRKEIYDFVAAVATHRVPDYLVSAFLMAVYLKGIDRDSAVIFTQALRDSGAVIHYNHLSGPAVDKHSTGGVGDKITLALAPLVAACGVPVPMLAGRGLGHTGGTIDKMEAIPGTQTHLSPARFQEQVETLGVCIGAQTDDFAPVDGIFYALRDVTGTIDSYPLVTASILSKKLAAGASALVLDIKVGRGAFFQTRDRAEILRDWLVGVGRDAGLWVSAFLTNMNEPLGTHVGNALEMREVFDILQGKGPPDTTELTLVLGSEMLMLGGRADSSEHGRALLQQAISDGSGLARMNGLFQAQGGDPSVLEDPNWGISAHLDVLYAPRAGFISHIDALTVGEIARALGAGRMRVDDVIDPEVGMIFLKKSGAHIDKGEPLVHVHHRGDPQSTNIARSCLNAFSFSDDPPKSEALILDIQHGK